MAIILQPRLMNNNFIEEYLVNLLVRSELDGLIKTLIKGQTASK